MKRKILIIAAVICFFSLALIAGAGSVIKKQEHLVLVRYELLLENIDSGHYTLDRYFTVGSDVYNQNGTARMGRVIQMETVQHRTLTVKNGIPVMAPIPGYVDCYITVESVGTYKDGEGIRICDIRIAAGGSYGIHIGGLFVPSASIIYAEVHE